MGEFNFNISLSILNHLGRNLYRNFITVIGEAISNSWDADANNVHIYIDKANNSFIIKDDGDGMTASDFQDKFLRIGYSKRKGGSSATNKKRPFIGRKGIGKLALLSCAKRISIITKTALTDYIGGTIDNRGLDEAITNDVSPQDYSLAPVLDGVFDTLKKDHRKGTIIYFQDIDEGIRNRIEYIKKQIALYFRFSLLDPSFNIYVNDELVTLDEIKELTDSTQFVWVVGKIEDPYITGQLLKNPSLKENKTEASEFGLSGFIASVVKPSNLKIRGTEEKVSIDLYVNGRLREKDILKHIPSTRVVESYLYGQIHYNALDDKDDRFTSSREGIVSDDPLFQETLKEVDRILKIILEDWDKWRVKWRLDGDSENDRIEKKDRKSKELVNLIADGFTPPPGSPNKDKVDGWVNDLTDDAQFNIQTYGECFISENLIRNYINDKNVVISSEATNEFTKWKKAEADNKAKGNISFEIRARKSDISYLSMDHLANLVDKVDPIKDAGLSRDAKEYKPIRDAVAHTALLTSIAKTRLNLTYENIKARIKTLLATP
ncbi:ATP-binding protein [Alistipes finegoldii]|uniref:ATP-binding protein n=1 Tax=Alistipes finegoldii TaxID=214856 RepID=UPI002803FE11|nr:ATP-binding protein [uncultured Alistipes sp.]